MLVARPCRGVPGHGPGEELRQAIITVMLKADGTSSNSLGTTGTWHCSEGALTVTWNDGFGSDNLIVSSNGTRLAGSGRMGTSVSAARR